MGPGTKAIQDIYDNYQDSIKNAEMIMNMNVLPIDIITSTINALKK